MSNFYLLKEKCLDFQFKFLVNGNYKNELDGSFSLYMNAEEWDLYGNVDSVYVLWMLGELEERTSKASRTKWAKKLLSCQDTKGWFTKRNLRGHSKEHATAYTIAALKMLEIEENESYMSKVKPLEGIKNIFSTEKSFKKWINRLGFKITLNDPVGHAGWNYIWRSSHLGGGITAALGMTRKFHREWWPGDDTKLWFDWYFKWLDKKVNKNTGYWQRALWNLLYPGPTLIDMAGAVHFYWVYQKYGHPLPYPEKIINSTLKVQKEDGLYRSYPMCIDLDGNFCLVRAFNQLDDQTKERYFNPVNDSITLNYNAVVNYLKTHPLEEIYNDSHGLPGALAALAECQELPGFSKLEESKEFKNPFEKVWWI